MDPVLLEVRIKDRLADRLPALLRTVQNSPSILQATSTAFCVVRKSLK
jgi:hypothetical protein